MTIASCSEEWNQLTQGVMGDGRIEFTVTTTNTVNETRGGLDPLAVTGYKKQLWLIPTVEDAAKDATRGTQFTSQSILDNFGVSAYKHGRTEDITEKRPDFFYNKEAVRDATTGKYSVGQDFYWPSGNEYLSFMAYAPYGSNLATLADIGASEPAVGPQKISFTVAADVTDQVDLMTAIAMQQYPSTIGTPNVNLQFEHQLAGIRFVVGQQFPTQGYIQKITLKNVYASGIYTLSDGVTPASWTYGSRYNYVAGTADQELTGEIGQSITTEAQTFLMLPCSFPDNDEAEVEIDYWDGYAVHTVSASLAGVTWEAGKTYTYELSSQNLTKLKVQSIAFAPTVAGTPHGNWQTGDKVGLYVVQGKDAEGHTDGQTLRYKNIPVTCAVTKVGSDDVVTWSVDHTTSQGNVYKVPGDSYYFYYPYKEGTPSGYPNECNELNASAPTFFSSVITAHTVFTDQSGVGAAAGNFEKSDLQVAKAVVPEDDGSNLPASTIKGAMERQVGLARMKFATSKTIPTVVTRTNNGTPTNSGTTTIYPSSNFSGNKPYLSGGVYYFFTKAGTPTTFNSVASDVNHWYSARTFNLASGAYTSDEEMNDNLIQDYRYQWQFVKSIYKYSYTGKCVQFTMPVTGKAIMECWGASGGSGQSDYGRGAYVAGNITLNAQEVVFVAIGKQGSNNGTTGSWNGGGPKSNENTDGSGGGATDIRLSATAGSSTWDNAVSLRSRIMVAAGGGGADDTNGYKIKEGYTVKEAAAGGGLSSVTCTHSDQPLFINYGASQTAGGQYVRGQEGVVDSGSFGYANQSGVTSCAGGGGGYWGGACSDFVGMGGSSFISGHAGCIALASSSGTAPSTAGANNSVERSTHYSGKYFTNTIMIDGAGNEWTTSKGNKKLMPNPNGGNYSSGEGRDGDGYSIITVTYE